MIKHYFYGSKLSKLIYDTKEPMFAEMREWGKIRKFHEENYPIRYWITNKLFYKIDNWINKVNPVNIFRHIQYRFANRFITHTHGLIASKEHLSRYEWHDMDQRIFYSLFDSFVDFVEIELAGHNYSYLEKNKLNYRGRSKEAGLDYLNWGMGLTKKKGEWWPDEEEGELEPQAISYREIYDLYIWYTETYKNRKTPHELSGLDDYYENKRKRNIDLLFDDDPEEHKWNTDEMYKRNREIEKQYKDEETEMLIRLIKIRDFLWT